MAYKFSLQKDNYEKFASGRVLYSIPGSAPFPVRLLDDIFQRAYELLGTTKKVNIYDPCIGTGYMMTVLCLLHNEKINSISGSDIDLNITKIAQKNLGLLQESGINNRIAEIEDMIKRYGKQSHIDALKDAYDIKSIITSMKDKIQTLSLVSDISNLIFKNKYDLIIFDMPYGNVTSWNGDIDINQLVYTMGEGLVVGGVLVVCTDKKIKINSPIWQSARKSMMHGKRKIFFIKR